MRDRDRPRLAKFLSYGDSGSSNNNNMGAFTPGFIVGPIYGPTSINNNSFPPPKHPTSPISKRKSRSKTKAKRSESKTSKTAIFENFQSLEIDNSPPRKRRSPSKSRLRSSQSRQALETSQMFSLPIQPLDLGGQPSSSPTNQRRSRSKTRVKRSQSNVSNLENAPPLMSMIVDPLKDQLSQSNTNNNTTSSATNNKKSKNKKKKKIQRSQSEAPNRILSDSKLAWEDLKENLQTYIYKPTKPTSNCSKCQCDQYPQYPSQVLLRSRSKSRSRKSVVSSTAGPYSLNSVAYVAPSCEDDLSSPGTGPSSIPGVGVRGRSKSRSRLNLINNGLTTVWPDSRGAWLPV